MAVPMPDATQPGPGQNASAPPPFMKVAACWTLMKVFVDWAMPGNAGKSRKLPPWKFNAFAASWIARPGKVPGVAPATLTVRVPPVFMQMPVTQTVLQGQTAIFSTTVTGAPPIYYRWIRSGIGVATSSVPFLILTNCQSNGMYRVAVTNLSTGVGGTSSTNAPLIVLPDFDRDGMADAWETQFGFNTNSLGDAGLDLDGDKMINRDEYIAGTDPTGYGGVVAGYANQRQVELLVEAGFTPLEAIRISTRNGATYLGRADRIGTIEAGKEADLIVVEGDPSRNVTDVEKVELVFNDGVGYDSSKLFESARGSVGIR